MRKKIRYIFFWILSVVALSALNAYAEPRIEALSEPEELFPAAHKLDPNSPSDQVDQTTGLPSKIGKQEEVAAQLKVKF